MGVIFQFYLIAPFLYKAVRKNWLVSAIVSIVSLLSAGSQLSAISTIPGFRITLYILYTSVRYSLRWIIFVLGMAAAAFWKQTGDRMQDYRLKLGLPVSIASTALILVWIFYYSQSRALWHCFLRLSGTFHPGDPAQYTACGILPPAGNGFQVSASAVLRSPEPVRDLSVAYAHHYDPAGQCAMVQHHEPAALLAVFAMYGGHHLRIRLFCNPLY